MTLISLFLCIGFSFGEGAQQSNDPLIKEGLYYYVEDSLYKELLVYKDEIFTFTEQDGISFFKFKIEGSELVIANERNYMRNKILSVEPNIIRLRNEKSTIVLHFIDKLDPVQLDLFEVDERTFWNQLVVDFDMRRWKYAEQQKVQTKK